MTQADYDEASSKALSLFEYGQVPNLIILAKLYIYDFMLSSEVKSMIKFSGPHHLSLYNTHINHPHLLFNTRTSSLRLMYV